MTKSNNLLADYAAKKQDICIKNDTISDSLFREYGVNRGLRDVNGKGVLTGLTNISEIVSFKTGEDGSSVPCDGQLWYRGYNVKTLTNNLKPGEFGFEKIAYLLLFGQLPSESELAEFTEVLGRSRTLPTNFTRDVIMKAPSKDIMNSMTRSILTLASYDPLVAKAGIDNNIRQCLSLVAIFPMLAVYGYHAYNHYENDQSMYIHRPDPKLSTAENFLRMLRADNQYTELEARVLDMALILHMEHGGGNNSTFTTRVVTSAGTDTYSAIAAAMSSLKGPKHGGANIKVMEMMRDIRSHVKHWDDEDEVRAYLRKMMDGEVFDHKGLIYGMGHAVYSLSVGNRAKLTVSCGDVTVECIGQEVQAAQKQPLDPARIEKQRNILLRSLLQLKVAASVHQIRLFRPERSPRNQRYLFLTTAFPLWISRQTVLCVRL